jgi:hypothetical protein
MFRVIDNHGKSQEYYLNDLTILLNLYEQILGSEKIGGRINLVINQQKYLDSDLIMCCSRVDYLDRFDVILVQKSGSASIQISAHGEADQIGKVEKILQEGFEKASKKNEK